jgi:hypothetical protein
MQQAEARARALACWAMPPLLNMEMHPLVNRMPDIYAVYTLYKYLHREVYLVSVCIIN